MLVGLPFSSSPLGTTTAGCPVRFVKRRLLPLKDFSSINEFSLLEQVLSVKVN